ncbi:MAG: hypothetical protein KF886_02235 [Candidatus Hydrogenedentes bacterium]|nr:hypothetical protein [Candidatus Hydrogenedentota bacterium]
MDLHLKELNPENAPLYIVPEREIDGFDHYTPGICLGSSNDAALDRLCKKLRVRSLSSFRSEDTEALQASLHYEGYALPEMPELTWFSAADGLETVRALAAHLEANPDALEDGESIAAELREYECILDRFDKEGIRWYMCAGY